jgi:DNA-binding response OmpR family regulator
MYFQIEPDRVGRLVVDAEPSITDAVWMMLCRQGDRVVTKETGRVDLAQRWRPHTMVFDVSARESGQACREVRGAAADRPIVSHDVGRRIAALDVGAADCLDGRFHCAELRASKHAVWRRVKHSVPGAIAGRRPQGGEL